MNRYNTWLRRLWKTGMTTFCIVAVVGCSKSYPGVEYEEQSMIGSNETFDAVPIMLTYNAPALNFSTRAYGPVDENLEQTACENLNFYIFAFLAPNHIFSDMSQIDFRKTSQQDGNTCLVDGSKTEVNPEGHGKLAKLSLTGDDAQRDGSLRWDPVDDRAYYNQMHQDYKYNFFTYCIDSAKVLNGGVKRTPESVYFDMEFDGRQDIISGIGRPRSLTSLLDKWKLSDGTYREDVKDIITNGPDNYIYSTMTGHRGVPIDFSMKHHLVRFQFNMRRGDDEADKVFIEDIILHAPNRGRFTVAHKDTTQVGFIPTGDTVAYHLPEIINGQYTETMGPTAEGFIETYSFGLTDVSKMPIGAHIMLPPQQSYKLELKCRQELHLMDGTIKETTFTPVYELTCPESSDTFMAGNWHTVNITVYGLREIEIQAHGIAWKKVEKPIEVGQEKPE